LKLAKKSLEHAVHIRQHIDIPKSPDAEPLGFEICRSLVVIYTGMLLCMLPAIELNDETNFEAHKVRNIRPDRILSPELEPCKSPSAHIAPKFPLCVRLIYA